MIFDAKKGQLRFAFDMKPAQPLELKGKTTTVTNFDDTYFVAFDFTGGDKAFSAKGLPVGCQTTTAAPTPDEAAKSWMDTISALGTSDTVPEDGIKFSEVLSTKFSIDCSKA